MGLDVQKSARPLLINVRFYMKKLLNKQIFWIVFLLLSISLLDVFPLDVAMEEAKIPYLGIALLAFSLLSFIAVILVFWVAYFAQGKVVVLILVLSWILLGFLPDKFYLLGTLVILGYWIYLKPEIQRYAQRT